MPRPEISELKPFLPSKDTEVSRRFYLDFGFDIVWETPDKTMTVFAAGDTKFLIQNAWLGEPIGDHVMHMMVPDVDAWFQHLIDQDLPGKYGTKLSPPLLRPWGLRDFYFRDPSGVFWRIAGVPK